MGESAVPYDAGAPEPREPARSGTIAVDTGRDLERARRGTRYERWTKPALDGLIASVLLLLALPVMAAVAAAVYVRLGRPVILRQQRVGLAGRPFEMFKFRTMEPDRRRANLPFSDPDRRRTHKSTDDPRHTPLGRWLRRNSLDELPQLINVLRGEMSLVGPRPELPTVVARYEAWQHRRHDVLPGVTGLWQVTARDEGDMIEHTELDLRYVESVSLATDLKLLARTVPAVLGLRPGE
jgi:lipopolysaccharide/colanic/teichoic acid biosynthesis glycosyltransferase